MHAQMDVKNVIYAHSNPLNHSYSIKHCCYTWIYVLSRTASL